MNEELTLKIERIFDAPIQKVWDAWTKPELLQQWSCPQTFEVTKQEGDLKEGGEWCARMESAELGYTGDLRGEYKLLDEPHKLVSTHQWVDDSGNDGKATEYTVELSEADGKTHMTFTQTGFVSAESRDSHYGGWQETFSKLDSLVRRNDTSRG
jgi:uncharacterized protein YndB with AHSA1/START domain